MPESQLRVLVLPSWYPTDSKPFFGIFIRKHALEMSKYMKVQVLYFDPNSLGQCKSYKISRTQVNENLHETIVSLGSYTGVFKKPIHYFLILWYWLHQILLKKSIQFDIIHVHVIYHIGIYLWKFLIFTRKPLVITEHWTGYLDNDGTYKRFNPLLRFMFSSLYKKARLVTAVSEGLKNKLDQLFNVGSKTDVISNVIDCSATPRVSPDLSVNPFTFLVISNFDNRQKNISGILDAFAELHRENKHTRLLLAGDGKDFSMLKEYATNLGLPPNTAVFLGLVPNNELSQLYTKAHCYVLNSNYETFSISTAEALLHGVPVISTRCNGPEEYVQPESGILLPIQENLNLLESFKVLISEYNKFNNLRISNEIKEKLCDDIGLKFIVAFNKFI